MHARRSRRRWRNRATSQWNRLRVHPKRVPQGRLDPHAHAPGPFRLGGEQPRGDGRGLTASTWELDCTCANEGAASARAFVITEGGREEESWQSWKPRSTPYGTIHWGSVGVWLGSVSPSLVGFILGGIARLSSPLPSACCLPFLLARLLTASAVPTPGGGNKAAHLPKGGSKFPSFGWIQHQCPSPFTSKWHHHELAPVPICTNHIPQAFHLSSPRAWLALTYSVVGFRPASGTRTQVSSVRPGRPHSPRSGNRLLSPTVNSQLPAANC